MIIILIYSTLLFYILYIGLLLYGFSKIENFELNESVPKTSFTILVPFRDELYNLPILLDSFSKLNYPTHLFEVILIDDDTKEVFQLPNFNYRVSLIKNNRISNSPKKDAITTAIKLVNTEWVVTTDADCIIKENWLLALDQYIQYHDVSMIAGAVTYDCKTTFLHHFQLVDFMSLQAVTIGSFGLNKGFICNGANFAYKASFFKTVEGFKGNDQIASGDDVFLLQKAMSMAPEKVHYLKSNNNIVHTKPLDNWKALFHQRLRWVSKTSSFQSYFGISLGFLVFVINTIWIITAVGFLLGFLLFREIVLFFVLKFFVEMVFIQKANQFLNEGKRFSFISASLVYPFFSITIAFFSLFGKYEWKGRKF